MVNSGWANLEAPRPPWFEGDSSYKFLSLSPMQRLYGFLACFVVGFVLSILGSILLTLGQLGSFAVLYTLGILVSLAGTGFVIGFATQFKLMFKPVRLVATIVFLGSIGLVFVGAFVLKSEVLCIIFVVIEYLAYGWYNLSYIPYARSTLLKLVGMS